MHDLLQQPTNLGCLAEGCCICPAGVSVIIDGQAEVPLLYPWALPKLPSSPLRPVATALGHAMEPETQAQFACDYQEWAPECLPEVNDADHRMGRTLQLCF